MESRSSHLTGIAFTPAERRMYHHLVCLKTFGPPRHGDHYPASLITTPYRRSWSTDEAAAKRRKKPIQ